MACFTLNTTSRSATINCVSSLETTPLNKRMEAFIMKIVVKKDYEEMSRYAAAKFISYMVKPGRVNIAPTAGSTPKRMYEIITDFLQGQESTLCSDKYYYQQDNLVSTEKPEVPSFFPEIDDMFWGPNNVPEARIKRLTLDTYKTAHEDIEKDGGLDFVLMGLGGDGHFAANMPGAAFGQKGYMEKMSEEMKKQIAAALGLEDGDAWTCLGAETLLQGKEILMIVTGEGKAEILKQVVEGPITEAIPSSVLRLHPNFTIVCDEAAAALLTK